MKNESILRSMISKEEQFYWQITGSTADWKFNPIYLLLTICTLGLFWVCFHLYRTYHYYVLTSTRLIVISGILVFVILLIATKLLSKLFKNIEQIKIIGGLNKILGFILGILKATLIVGVVNCILVALSLIPPVNKAITPVIQDNSHVEKVIYNTTDKLFEKYVIEGDMLKNWVENLWEKR